MSSENTPYVTYDAGLNVIVSQCSHCGQLWQNPHHGHTKPNNCSVEKVDNDMITVKLHFDDGHDLYLRYENVCDPCTVKKAKESDDGGGWPGSENIDQEGHSYVKGECICGDETYTETRKCFRCQKSFEKKVSSHHRTSMCQAVDVKNENGRVSESAHRSRIAICSFPPPMCDECDEHYVAVIESGGGPFATYSVKEKVAQ